LRTGASHKSGNLYTLSTAPCTGFPFLFQARVFVVLAVLPLVVNETVYSEYEKGALSRHGTPPRLHCRAHTKNQRRNRRPHHSSPKKSTNFPINMMITPSTLSPQEPLFSIIGRDDTSICLSDIVQDTMSMFSWSDFPCQNSYERDESYTPTVWTYSSCQLEATGDCFRSRFPLQHNHLTVTRKNSRLDQVPVSRPLTGNLNFETVSRKRKTGTKTLTFADDMEVRTYSVIVGDHPCCMGGLALQCGWDYSDATAKVDFGQHQKNLRRPHDFRLTYCERRERLEETTGMNPNQLLHEEFRIMCSNDSQLNVATDMSCKLETIHHSPSLLELSSLWMKSY
jgi:hypothetical protein